MLDCSTGKRRGVVIVINGRCLKFSPSETGGLLEESQLFKPKFSNRLQCLFDVSNIFDCDSHFPVHKSTINS